MLWRSWRKWGVGRAGALAITAAYALVGGFWVLASDRVLEQLVSDLPGLGGMQTVKGWFYVVATAAVLYPLVRRWERHLRRSEERYRVLFSSGGDAVFVYQGVGEGQDPGRLVEVNAVACEWLGYTRGELLARTYDEVRKRDALSGLEGAGVEPSGGPPNLFDSELVTRDGRLIPVEVTTHGFVLDRRPMVLAIARDIRERRAAQTALARERDLLHALMDNIPDLIYFKDAQSRFTRVNRVLAETLGLPQAAQAVGRTDAGFYDETHARDALAGERRIVSTGEPLIDKLERIRRCDGTHRWVTATKAPIKDDSGRVVGIVGISRDVTERRRAEQALLLRDTAVNASIAGMVSTSLDGTVTDANPSFLRMWGYDEVDGVRWRPASDLFASYQQAEEIASVLWRAGQWVGDVRAKRQDGTCFDAQVWVSMVRNEEGSPIALIAWAIDITERLEAERALRASEEKYRLLVENSNEVILVAQDGWLRYVNRRAEELFGIARQELLDNPIAERIHPGDRALVMGRHRARLRGEGYPRPYAFRVMNGRNEVRWVELSGVSMEWEGKPASLNFISDITERKQAEDALRESEERYRTVVENLGEGIAMADQDDRFTFANPAAEAIFGVEPGTLAGQHVADYVTPGELATIEAQTVLRRQGLKSTYEIEIERPDGQERTILLTAAPQIDRLGRFVGTFGIFRDVTERKRADAEREKLIAELQEALAQVKTLRGLLPICASCKKVRDDGGYWHMVETYVRDHSQAEFTHTLCPECMARLYPQYVDAGDEEEQR